MDRIGIAILGSGAIAKVHADSFKALGDICEVRAVCDIFPDKAEALIKEKELDAAALSDYSQLWDMDGIDAVSICLPPGEHAKAAVAALEHGMHVITEKPMATSLEECDAMINAAKRNGRLLASVAQNRYKIPMMKVKEIISSGAIGKILQTNINSWWWRGQNYYDLWWRGTWEKETGGCTTSHATHHIDLMLWMLGKPRGVTAIMGNVGHDNSECEDLVFAVFDYPGSMALVNASLVSHGEEQEMIFQGEKAGISIPWKVRASKPLGNGFPEPSEEEMERVNALYDAIEPIPEEGHIAQLRNFVRAIRGEEELFITGQDGRNTIEMIMGIYKSAAEHKAVTFPIASDDPFYRKETMVRMMPHFHEKLKSVDNLADVGITLGRDVGK